MNKRLIFAAVAVLSIPMGLRAQNIAQRLDFSDNIRMVSCDPVSTAPCFRLKFNLVDAQGAPSPAQIPAPEKLAQSITIRVEDQPVTPFFALMQGGEGRAVRRRTALVLVDISGSMNRKLPSGQTRFDAAKAALSSFLEGFEKDADRVAVVPFESHQVEPTIRGARFASTKEEALQQVQTLPRPKSNNNTGLYSAVAIGLDVLSAELKAKAAGAESVEGLLMVMTDGTNEVLSGDDTGLLAGPVGLQQVATKVQAFGIQVIGVGFGDPKEIDETALRQISTRYQMAADVANLKKIFAVARTLLSNRIQATFTSPWADRASLAGKTLHVSVQLKLPTGQLLSSDQRIWSTPQIGVPLYESHCDTDEMRALVQSAPPPGTGWMSVLRPVLVFLGLGTLLLILWFWIPRLIWAEQYIGIVPTQRWESQAAPIGKAIKPAPPGFDAGKPDYRAPRAPSDPTVRRDFTKTRLEPPPGGDRSRK
jgi:Mg-chelatase subunit ChlD